MIMDKQTVLRDNVALTAVATTVSDAYDVGAGKSNLGRGRPLRAKVVVGTAFTSGGAGTLQVNYIQSANSDLSAPDVLVTGPVNALAALTAGASLMDIVLPDNTKRYVGFQEVIGTAAMTGGKITSAIVETTNSAGQYASAT
jgi:hypothetical protein